MNIMQTVRRVAGAPILRRCGGAGGSSLMQQRKIVGSVVGKDCAPAMLGRVPLILARWASTARDVSREADQGLLHVLRTEMEHERKTYSHPKELKGGPPKPWTLTDKPGYAYVSLRRSYGEEDIELTCVYQPDDAYRNPEEEDEDEDDDSYKPDGQCSVILTMTIKKGVAQPSLEISLTSSGEDIQIGQIYFWEDKADKEGTYDGPNFLELDDKLQNQFEKFVKARGVNRDFIKYLFVLMPDKEKREYTRWLQKLDAFIKE